MLTEVICDFVGAICIDPEKDSPCASDNTSTFVHSDSNEDSTGVHRLHVYVTWHPQVMPDNRKYIQLLTIESIYVQYSLFLKQVNDHLKVLCCYFFMFLK